MGSGRVRTRQETQRFTWIISTRCWPLPSTLSPDIVLHIESGLFPYRAVFLAWWESKTPVDSRFHSCDFFHQKKKTGTPFLSSVKKNKQNEEKKEGEKEGKGEGKKILIKDLIPDPTKCDL